MAPALDASRPGVRFPCATDTHASRPSLAPRRHSSCLAAQPPAPCLYIPSAHQLCRFVLSIVSGNAARRKRDTTPRTLGRCSVMLYVSGLSGTRCSAHPKFTASSAHRLRLLLDARYTDGDDGRCGLGSLHPGRHGSDAGSSPSGSRLCLPAKPQPVCSPVRVRSYPSSILAASFGAGSLHSRILFHGRAWEHDRKLHKEWCATRAHHALLQQPFTLAPDHWQPWLRSWQSSKSSNIMSLTRYRQWEELRPRFASRGH